VTTPNTIPAIIVHGGAGGWTNADDDQILAGMKQAASAGWAVLSRGRSALDAVEAATIVLEDHPLFDAGFGSFLNDCGEVEMDALITDGSTIDFGAVAAVRHVRNPISLARLVMTETRHSFFVAEGADRLAIQLGISPVCNLSMVTDKEFAAYQEQVRNTAQVEEPGHGTVGAVAIDVDGHIASATTSGGSRHKLKGRVGDVPIYGAGGYSDDRSGGASATGVGENIMRYFLSKYAVDLIASGALPLEATQAAVKYVARHIPNPEVGVITVDASGNIGAAHTTNGMPIAWVDSAGVVHADMREPYPLG
jgi:beta-aspartyl-peptidase (threonine type)